MSMDNYDDVERHSYIIEFVKDGKKFICNRNSDMYTNIFKDKYVSFWGIEDISELDTESCDMLNIVKILYGISNYNKQEQKYINIIKKEYIDDAIENDEELLNLQFVESTKAYRKYYKDQYKKFLSELWHIKDLEDKLYDMAKKLFYKENNMSYLENSRYWDIWTDKRISIEQRILVIMLRDYIYDRKIKKFKYPFDKKQIKRTINNIISSFKKSKLNKNISFEAICI